MKYFVFFCAATLGVPVMAWLATTSTRMRGVLLALLVLSTAMGDLANINFWSLEHYRGPDRGFEVNVADLIAVALLLSLLLKDFMRLDWLPYNSIVMGALLLVAVISTLVAPVPLYGGFTLFKLIRFYIIYWCVVNCLKTGTPAEYIWWGFVGIGVLLTFVTVQQKFLHGVYRVYGTFDHSNTIPPYVNLLLPALLAWALLDRRMTMRHVVIGGLASIGLSFAVVATFSRAGTVLAVAAIVSTVLLNLRRAHPLRVSLTTVAVGFVLFVGGIKMADSIIERFLNAPESSFEAREEFNESAAMMAADHPFGAGLNNFSHVLTNTPRYRAHISVMESEGEAGVAHNIYWLTAAETGYPGLILLLVILGRFTWLAAWHAVVKRGARGGLLAALFVGLMTHHLGAFLEWTTRTTPVMYMLAIVFGLTVAMSRRDAVGSLKKPPGPRFAT